MLDRLEKCKEELEKAKKKKVEWETKVKRLEKKVQDEERQAVHEMVKAANLSPEELARLIAHSKEHLPGEVPMEDIVNTDDRLEDTDDEV